MALEAVLEILKQNYGNSFYQPPTGVILDSTRTTFPSMEGATIPSFELPDFVTPIELEEEMPDGQQTI